MVSFVVCIVDKKYIMIGSQIWQIEIKLLDWHDLHYYGIIWLDRSTIVMSEKYLIPKLK